MNNLLRNIYHTVSTQKFRKSLRIKLNQWKAVINLSDAYNSLKELKKFKYDFKIYKSIEDTGMALNDEDIWPCLNEKTYTTNIPPHYFYQSAWLARKVAMIKPVDLVDVGSQIDLIAPLSAFVPITFIDLRPIETSLPEINCIRGSILELPYNNDSVINLSCLHVIEHIGLGRYSDALDPNGTKKAAHELTRVLAKGGNLFLSTPVGRERICFNAHRVHSPITILKYFSKLSLVEFACESNGKYYPLANPEDFINDNYSCGMFWFKK